MSSENGWEPPWVGVDALEWVAVPGTGVNLQLMKGQPSALLKAWAADWNAFIEPLRDADSAGYTPTNSVSTSNHLNGTAIDLNWDDHPFHVRGTLNADQMVVLRQMLDFYEDTVFWAGDWDDPIDEMHSQCGYDTYQNPHTQDFIDRKIRADGFSTFRRDAAPLSRADRYALAIIQEGRRLGITPRGIKIALSVGLVETNLTNYANSNDPPSLNFPHDAVGSDHMSVGWAQQQPNWGSLQCRMDITCAATLFFACDNGPGTRGLTKIRERINRQDGDLYDYNDTSHSPGFYAQKVQGSAFPDRYDERYSEAEQLYNRLAAITPGEDWLNMPSNEDKLDFIYNELSKRAPSRAIFADNPEWGETQLGYVYNGDANTVNVLVVLGALAGDATCADHIRRVAKDGPLEGTYAAGVPSLVTFGQELAQAVEPLIGSLKPKPTKAVKK